MHCTMLLLWWFMIKWHYVGKRCVFLETNESSESSEASERTEGRRVGEGGCGKCMVGVGA